MDRSEEGKGTLVRRMCCFEGGEKGLWEVEVVGRLLGLARHASSRLFMSRLVFLHVELGERE